jgi:adenine-specific DNA-methyltransferase
MNAHPQGAADEQFDSLDPTSDPKGTMVSAKFWARAWVHALEKDRIWATRTFIAEAISRYAIAVGSGNRLPALGAASGRLTGYPLDRRAVGTAAHIGATAARLDPLDAGYLISAIYTAMLPPELRSRYGIYYTPPALTRRLMTMATEAGVDWSRCRVLDPACGGGAFMAPAALRMASALKGCEPTLILQSIGARLRGLEIDPFAAWMSQAFLEIALADVCRAADRRLPRLVTVCDSLNLEPDGEGFDLVIGNPPYGRIGLSPEMRRRYRRSLYGHANQYGVFTDLALRWSLPGGVIAYVTPTSFLAGEYFKALRALLAREAPPAAVDFIADRKGVFEDALQETLLATYRRGGSAAEARVHYILVETEGSATVTEAGGFRLPADPAKPWLLPRVADHAPLIARLARMTTRLRDWGYKVSTGPLVWNRHKDQLRSHPGRNTSPLIWAEAIAGPGRFVFRADKKNHEPYFELGPGDGWLTIDEPCVLVQRTTAKEQARRLIAAELPESFVRQHGRVVVENHLNMIRPLDGAPEVSPAAVAALLNTQIVDDAFRCISGSVAVSAFELEALPLPSPEQARTLEALLADGVDRTAIEAAVRSMYLPSSSWPCRPCRLLDLSMTGCRQSTQEVLRAGPIVSGRWPRRRFSSCSTPGR